MQVLQKLGLRTRLQGAMITLVILLVIPLVFLQFKNQQKGIENIAAKVAKIANETQTQQKETLEEVKNKQITDTNTALSTKAESLGSLLARLASTPLLASDNATLIKYCSYICRDPNIVMSYITNSRGEIQATFLNERNAVFQSLASRKRQADSAKLIKALKALENIFEVKKDVVQANKVLGQAVLLFSKNSIKGQDTAINANYGAISAGTEKMFSTLQEVIHEESQESLSSTKHFMAVAVFVSIFLAFIVSYYIANGISTPLTRVVELVKKIAHGDLTEILEVDSQDEIGELVAVMKTMENDLSNIVGNIITGSENVFFGANQIASGNLDLSQRSQEQASALEETVATIEQVTANIKANAENAQKANELAVTTAKAAQKGREDLLSTVMSMAELTESSKKIGDIINVVNEISFQTNLLALNAAVEAARAGEHGRGFAVVAGEVRSLAGRSAEAAKTIQGLINDSIEKVEMGNRKVSETTNNLEHINRDIEKVAQVVSEITAASQEQASGIDQVNRAITQIDETVQQNASLVEEAAATSENLSAQAQELKQIVSAFKVNGRHNGHGGNNSVTKKVDEEKSVPGKNIKSLGTPQQRDSVKLQEGFFEF